MRLWRFSDPMDDRFARVSRRGTWEGNPPRRISPLIIEWEPGSSTVGDFTWPGFDSDIVISQRVAEFLRDNDVSGFELGPLKMQENSERPKRRSKKPVVSLPYYGELLFDLIVTGRAAVDRGRSTLEECSSTSGDAKKFSVRGVERRESTWDQVSASLVTRTVARVEGQGLFVHSTADVFRIPELPAWIFCTDVVKQLVEKRRFTNVCFLEMGEVLSN